MATTAKLSEKNKVQQNDAANISINLNAILRSRNLEVNKLAHELNIPIMTIRRLLLGDTTDPRISTLKLIADYLGIPVDSLINVNNHQYCTKEVKNIMPQFIPILDWETAGKINSIHDINLSQWSDWQPFSLRNQDSLSSNAFALKSRHSMYPRFPLGTIFIIDPNATPTDGDVVLLKFKENNELTLKELNIDPPNWLLKSIISGSDSFKYSKKEHKIIGVNLFTMLYKEKV